MNGKDRKTGGTKSLVSSSRYALDDLMACLTDEPDGDDRIPPEASGTATEKTQSSDAAAPSPALAAALDAVLRIAEETVLEQAKKVERPVVAPPRMPVSQPPAPDPEQADPCLLVQDAPTGARIPAQDPILPPERASARSPAPKAAARTALPDPAQIVHQGREADGARIVLEDRRNAPRQATAPRKRGGVSKTPAAMRTSANRAVADSGETKQLVDLLQELGQTLDSAEILLADCEPPSVAPFAPTAPPPPPPRRIVSRRREGAILASLFLCLFAGLGGIVYSNSEWLIGAAARLDPITAEQANRPVEAVAAAEKEIRPLPKIASVASVAPVATDATIRAVDIAITLPEKTSESPPTQPALPAEPVADQGTAAPKAGPLVARGRALLETGDIGAARLVFEHAARRGNAEAMLALAQSYDPGFLLKLDVHGIRPDVDQAMAWYQHAARSQSAEAGLDVAPYR